MLRQVFCTPSENSSNVDEIKKEVSVVSESTERTIGISNEKETLVTSDESDKQEETEISDQHEDNEISDDQESKETPDNEENKENQDNKEVFHFWLLIQKKVIGRFKSTIPVRLNLLLSNIPLVSSPWHF